MYKEMMLKFKIYIEEQLGIPFYMNFAKDGMDSRLGHNKI